MPLISVRTTWGFQDVIEVPADARIGDLKRIIQERSGRDASSMRAYYCGRPWNADDSEPLAPLQRETVVTFTLDGDAVARDAAPAPEEHAAAAAAVPEPAPMAEGPSIYRPRADEPSVRASLRTLTNKFITVDVPLDMKIGEIKRRILEPATAVYTERVTPAVQMVIIYLGKELPDSMTPRELNLQAASVLHLGRIMDAVCEPCQRGERDHVCRDPLSEVMYPDRLHANCVHCRTPGVPLGLRPGCPKCGEETVIVKKGTELEVGKSRWRDMLKVQVQCWNNLYEGVEDNLCSYRGAGSTFMLCKREGDTCPSRKQRKFDLRFVPATEPEAGQTLEETNRKRLVAFLNSLFCYPHEGGL